MKPCIVVTCQVVPDQLERLYQVAEFNNLNPSLTRSH